MLKQLKERILKKKAKVGIIGLGYVGLPLAVTFAKKGFKVYGIDIDKDRVARVNRCESYILDVPVSDMKNVCDRKSLKATSDFSVIKELDAVIICVPTPLNKTKEPDVSYIVSAVRNIKKHMKRGQIIVLESTTYPGTTDEVMLPILEEGNFKEGRDFYLAFSPERIDPSNEKYNTKNTPKIIGGLSKESTEIARLLYGQVIDKIVTVSSAKVAEMAKLLENTFRIVNIGLVNELLLMCDKLGIDMWEVIDAAKTKPYGFMPFYPGPGVGGHCLAKDEYIHVRDDKRSGLNSIKISDFIKESLEDPRSKMHNFRGSLFVKPFAKEVFSYDIVNSKPCYREIGLLSERPYNGRMVNIKTQDNRTISVTEKHPVIIRKEGEFGIKFADELEIGDEIPIVMNMPQETREEAGREIDIIDFLQSNNLIHNIRVKPVSFNWSDFGKDIKNHTTTKKEKLRDYFRNDSLPLNTYLELEKAADLPFTRRDIRLVTGKGPSFQSMPAVFDIDEYFVRFVGYYLAEGCITKDRSLRTRITFNSAETPYINDVILFLEENDIGYSIYRSKVWKSVCIKISSDIFGYLLRDMLHCGVNSYEMKIPERFFSLPKQLKVNLLMGILRGDGGVDYVNIKRSYIKKGRRYIHGNNSAVVNYFTSSDTMFNQVVLLLQDLGFVPSFKKRKNLLNIFGFDQLKRLKSFFLGEKRNRLKAYIENNKKIIRNKTFKICGNLAMVKIKDISYSRVEKVYSMEVKGTNTFVTSYSMLTHNCIPVDPIYLSWKARGQGFEARFIDLASYINSQMPHYVVEKVAAGLNGHKKPLKGSKILLIGVAYKKDVKDLRESPALEIINILEKKGAVVSYHDPHLPYLKIDNINLKSVKLDNLSLKNADCVVIVTDHSNIDYKFVARNAKLIVDTRNVLKDVKDRSNIIKL